MRIQKTALVFLIALMAVMILPSVSALTGNVTSLATGRSGASWTGNVNATFYADFSSIALDNTIGWVNWSISPHNSTAWIYVASDINGSGNQTIFSQVFDSAGYADGRYSLRAQVYNYTNLEGGVSMVVQYTTASSTLIINNNTAITVTLLQNVGANGTVIEEDMANATLSLVNVTAPEEIIFGSILFDSNNYTMTCANAGTSYCWFDVISNNIPDQSYDYEITLVGTGADDVVKVNRDMIIERTGGGAYMLERLRLAKEGDNLLLWIIIFIIIAVVIHESKKK